MPPRPPPPALCPHRPQCSPSALRADSTALLAAGAHGRTRCAACGRSARTAAVSQKTKRAARAAPAAALLVATPRGRWGHRAGGGRGSQPGLAAKEQSGAATLTADARCATLSDGCLAKRHHSVICRSRPLADLGIRFETATSADGTSAEVRNSCPPEPKPVQACVPDDFNRAHDHDPESSNQGMQACHIKTCRTK